MTNDLKPGDRLYIVRGKYLNSIAIFRAYEGSNAEVRIGQHIVRVARRSIISAQKDA